MVNVVTDQYQELRLMSCVPRSSHGYVSHFEPLNTFLSAYRSRFFDF